MEATRITPADRAFYVALFGRAEMLAHRPDPTPDSEEVRAATFDAGLAHWARTGFGPWCIRENSVTIGFYALRVKPGVVGLNLSYHLAPETWGGGRATQLVRSMVGLARAAVCDGRLNGPLTAMARPANPASARVLEKCGFAECGMVPLGGQPTRLFQMAFEGPGPQA